jgi:hypothetical protein
MANNEKTFDDVYGCEHGDGADWEQRFTEGTLDGCKVTLLIEGCEGGTWLVDCDPERPQGEGMTAKACELMHSMPAEDFEGFEAAKAYAIAAGFVATGPWGETK